MRFNGERFMRSTALGVRITTVIVALCLAQSIRCEERHAEEFPDGTGFSYVVPEGWKLVEKPKHNFKVLVNEAGAVDGFSPNITFRDGQFEGKLSDFAEQTKKGFKGSYPAFEELLTDEVQSEYSGNVTRVIAANDLNGRKVRQVLYMFQGPGRLKLAMTTTTPFAGGERYDGMLELTAKSLRFDRDAVQSEVLNTHFDAMMKAMAAHVKDSGVLGKNATDAELQEKVIAPVAVAIKEGHMLEVTKEQAKNFEKGVFLEDSNKKILDDMSGFIQSFKDEIPPAAKYVIDENTAGHLKGADLEVGIRIMKWALTRLRESIQHKAMPNQNTPPNQKN